MESTGEKKMVPQGSGPAEGGSREVESSAEKKGRGPLYPVRPHQPDCAFYLRTGYCRYGAGCRFNHPMKKMVKLENPSKTAAQVAEENPERVGKMECKFYSLPGGCRYGNACKFVHCPEKTDKKQTEKTDKGQSEKTDKGQTGSRTIRFPIRPEDVECPMYMVAGYCKLSAACKFQHPPLPTSVVTSEFIFQGRSTFSGYANGGSGRVSYRALPLAKTFEQPLQSSLDASLPYQVYNKTGQDPTASTPSSPKETVKHSRAPTMSKAAGTTNQEGNTEEHPDSAFRFNLLNGYLTSTPTVTVSPVGLPLRPDQPVCKYYSRFGLCKFGIGCQFDHPVNYGSLIVKSSDQAPTSNNTCRNGSQ